MSAAGGVGGRTEARRAELYRDRWSARAVGESGLTGLSEMLSLEELRRIELFAEYDDQVLEKVRPDVAVASWRQGAVLFEEGSYIDLAFFVEQGEVEIFLEQAGPARPRPIFDRSRTMILSALPQVPAEASGPSRLRLPNRPKPSGEITMLATMDFDLPRGERWRLGPGELFGEIGALSGWPQSVTARAASDCRLVQIRLPALRILRGKSKALKERLDAIYRDRSLALQLESTPLFAGCNAIVIDAVKEAVELVSCNPDESITQQGEPADALYLVRSGFVKLEQTVGEGQVAVSYLSKGMTLGEVELLLDEGQRWQFTASSVEYSELVKIPRRVLDNLMRSTPTVEEQLLESAVVRLKEAGRTRQDVGSAEFLEVALHTGLVQGNSVLAIDLDVCTRCDDCVRACADTHGGRPRFVREGNSYRNLVVAKSCYHCRDPVCLVGCPTGAIHRAGIDEVVSISDEVCIGCSVCARNCPYDAIVMHDAGETWPDDMIPAGLRGRDRAIASKCDMCVEAGHDPACVTSCPQGCAYRVGTLDEFDALLRRSGEEATTAARAGRALGGRRWQLGGLAALVAIAAAMAVNLTLGELTPRGPWGLAYGWAAAALAVASALLGARRRTLGLAARRRLGGSRAWLLFHVWGGSFFLLLMLLHTGFRVPQGQLTLWLWSLSLVTVASGFAGLAIQSWIPRVLSSGLGTEAVYERIPALVEELGKEARELAERSAEPVRDFFDRRLVASFAAPARRWAFLLDITGGIQARLREFDYLRRLLSADDRERLARLEQLFQTKLELDAHFTLQRLLRWWIYAHAPVSLLLLGLLVVHVLAVWWY